MAEAEGAGAGNAGQSGSGAPEGGSPEGGSENDEKPITARQLKAALASQRVSFEEKLAAKDRELEAFKEGLGKRQAEEKPKTYTRPQLKAAVESGQITQEQADEYWDTQRETQIRESAKKDALDAVTAHATKERIDADLASYKRLKPEILDPSHEVRQSIQEEFKALLASGLPNDLRTELAAIRAVVGPLEKLSKAAKETRVQETEQQGGSGGEGRPKAGAGNGKTLFSQLNATAKAHYEGQIKRGTYKDEAAIEAELKYASPRTRQKLGLPA